LSFAVLTIEFDAHPQLLLLAPATAGAGCRRAGCAQQVDPIFKRSGGNLDSSKLGRFGGKYMKNNMKWGSDHVHSNQKCSSKVHDTVI
jgi:hypothetical protein